MVCSYEDALSIQIEADINKVNLKETRVFDYMYKLFQTIFSIFALTIFIFLIHILVFLQLNN